MRENGSVLLLVLVMVAVLSVVVLDSIRVAELDWEGAAGFRSSLQAESLALSAEAIARKVLIADTTQGKDTWEDEWATWERGWERTDPFATGTLRMRITDESARFPLRRLLRHSAQTDIEAFTRLVRLTGFDGDAQAYAKAVVDWQDVDLVEPSGGLESERYAAKNKTSEGILCPSRPMLTLGELLLIRWPGMAPGQAEAAYYGVDGRAGLKDLCSVYSTALNVNTILPEVARCLVPDEDQADAFAEDLFARRRRTGDGTNWNGPVFVTYGVKFPVTGKGVYFRVEAIATAGATTMRMECVLHRHNGKLTRMYRAVW